LLLFLSADSPEPKGRKVVVMLTLRKLKEMVESPKKGEKKPSCKSLREGKYPVVAQKIIKNKVGVVTITVYKNGYVVYQAQNRVTVFPIEDISGYRYSSVTGNGYGCNLTESYFEEAEWYLRFVLRGEDRLSINLDSCNQKRCISLSSAMEEMQLGESIAPDMEEMIVQQMMTENMMDMLTDKQKELIYALYFEKQTYQEYADIHGISSAAVNNMRNKAVAKLRASLEELAESNEKKKLRKK
jgi:predicted DNA-binding protein YlxM (UPF0122 family)